jgi:energy-coupling factor transporter ATP-binding protein EcfA2
MVALAVSEFGPGAFSPSTVAGEPLARLVGIGKTYGSGEHAVAALKDATVDIRAGEVILIEGPSGSGKTTLISILGLLLRASEGEVWIDGKNVAKLGEKDLPALRAMKRSACSGSWASPRACITCPRISRAGRSNASRSRARSAATRRSSSATSRPLPSIPRPRSA